MKNELLYHVPVGNNVWISPRGVSDAVYIRLTNENQETWDCRLDYNSIRAILHEAGLPVEKDGWASWEHDDWKIEEQEVVPFHNGGDVKKMKFLVLDLDVEQATFTVKSSSVGSSSSAPIKDTRRTTRHFHGEIVLEKFIDLILETCTCEHFKTGDEIHLKQCRSCIMNDKNEMPCWHDHYRMKPLLEVNANWRRFMKNYFDLESGVTGAWLKFQLTDLKECYPTRWNRFIAGMKATHEKCTLQDPDKYKFSFTKYYEFGSVRYKVFVDKNGTGLIRAEVFSNTDTADEWESAMIYLRSKVFLVMEAFKAVCWHAEGHVIPTERENWEEVSEKEKKEEEDEWDNINEWKDDEEEDYDDYW